MKVTFDTLNPAEVAEVLALLGSAGAAPATQAPTAPTAPTAPVTQAPTAPTAPTGVTLDELKQKMVAAIAAKGNQPMEVFNALKAGVQGFVDLPSADPSIHPQIAAVLDGIVAGG